MELKLRRDYERPWMRVVEVRNRCCILAGSGTQGNQAMRNGYGAATTDIWE